MRPLLIFDKSFLQSLSVDEAVMLDQMFSCVITPLFFVETMADLTKEPKGGRTAEQIVGGLAERTPVVHSYVNTFHYDILLGELLGDRATMDHRPVVAGGVPVRSEGRTGVVYKKSEEAEAFERWQCGRFLEVERIAARAWRDKLGDIDLPAMAQAYKSLLRKEARPRSHDDARVLSKAIVNLQGQNYKLLVLAHGLLGMPMSILPHIIKAWKAAGSLTLSEYAPFTAHCLEVDLYFYLALSNGIISDQRASNRIDISYLYYLPFATIFASGDRLHQASAPRFFDERQHFAWGPDLKRDLAELNVHFLALPDEEKAKGLFSIGDRPPTDHLGLCATLWDRCRPNWRTPKTPMPKLTSGQHDDIIGRSNRLIGMAEKGVLASRDRMPSQDQLSDLIIQRDIPRQRGSWRMFSAEIEAADDAENARRRSKSRPPKSTGETSRSR